MAGRHAPTLDRSALTSEEGVRAAKISTAGLAATAAVQFAIVAVSGSAALLADALHNFGDVFTTVALWVAFIASRRAADRRYTFGYGRFEDLVGLGVVVIIAASAFAAGFTAWRALVEDRVVSALGISIGAALVGVAGNEAVARYKIKTGKRIHSVALEADGYHSRTDGLVSAGAVVGLVGVALGFPLADPIAGLAITASIVWITVRTSREVFSRLVDAVDPGLVADITRKAEEVAGVKEVHGVRARWAGRSLYVQMHLCLDENLLLHEAHAIGEGVRHSVLHDFDGVSQVLVHFDPWGEGKHQGVYHTTTAHHLEEGNH